MRARVRRQRHVSTHKPLHDIADTADISPRSGGDTGTSRVVECGLLRSATRRIDHFYGFPRSKESRQVLTGKDGKEEKRR